MEQVQNDSALGSMLQRMAKNKTHLYQQLSIRSQSGGVVLVGDSLVEFFPIYELYRGPLSIYNRGVAGNTTHDVLKRSDDTVISIQPKTVILLAGINDFMPFVPHNTIEEIVLRLIQIGKHIASSLRDVNMCIQSLYPVNEEFDRGFLNGVNNDQICTLNDSLNKQCNDNHFTFIDVYPHLLDKDRQLDKYLTLDGIHVNVSAYKMILGLLCPHF